LIRQPFTSRPTPAAAVSVLVMAAQNLLNMIGVGVVAGTVVLGLFAAKQW
jgi:hypothetical protein